MLTIIPLDTFEELKHQNHKLGESMECLDQECENLSRMNGAGDKIRTKIWVVLKKILWEESARPDS